MNNVLALQLLSIDTGAGAVEDGSVDGGHMEAASHVSALTCGGGDGDNNSHASLLLCR